MARSRRVTLRCLCADFHQDWDDSSDEVCAKALRGIVAQRIDEKARDSDVASVLRRMRPLSQLRHPMIHAFDTGFSSEDDGGILRQSIKSVKDRQWLKQTYSSRWRGAAIEIKDTAWLCSAGYHREGSPEDFYTKFASECSESSDGFLPQKEDAELERIDKKIADRDAWTAQLHLSTLVLLAHAMDSSAAGPLTFPRPNHDDNVPVSESNIAVRLDISVETVDVDGDEASEIFVKIASEDPNSQLNQIATRVILAAIDSEPQAWSTTWISAKENLHSVILTNEIAHRATETRTAGAISARDVPGAVRLGTVAHWTREDGLTQATLQGDPVHALCGHWFVPMHDHASRELCQECAAVGLPDD